MRRLGHGKVLRREALREHKLTQLSNQLINHREQFRQLDEAERTLAMGRLRLVQEMIRLQSIVAQIDQKNATLADRYWLHTDPERRFSGLEVQRSLYVLEQAELDDGYSLLTRILLHEKLGDYDYAEKLCDGMIHSNSPLSTTARAIQVYLGFLQNREEAKNSKALKTLYAEFNAIDPNVLRNGTIFDRWLLAEIYVLQGQWSHAERGYKQLKKNSLYEMPARRRLSQIYYHKSTNSRAVATKALVEAQEAFDLEPMPDWQSHAVLALAHAANKDFADAMPLFEEAAKLAQREQVPLIERLSSQCESETKPEWELFRTFEKHTMSEQETLALDQLNAEESEQEEPVIATEEVAGFEEETEKEVDVETPVGN